MARLRDNDLWALVRAERAGLAEDLSCLNAEQWRHGTLCGQWDGEEVVAHLGARSSSNRESMGRQNALRINLPTSYDRASVPTW